MCYVLVSYFSTGNHLIVLSGNKAGCTNFLLSSDNDGDQHRVGMLKNENMPTQKRRSMHKKDAMNHEETETLLSPNAGPDHLDHHDYYPQNQEDDGFRVDPDTEPLTPTTPPPLKSKLTYMPQFIPQLPISPCTNTLEPRVTDTRGSLAPPVSLTHSLSANSGFVRPPKMSLLKKRDRHNKTDLLNSGDKKKLGSQPNTFDKSSSVEDAEGNLVPINPMLLFSDNGDVDNKTAMTMSNSGASNTGESMFDTPRSPAGLAERGELNALRLNTLGEEGNVVDSDNGIYVETALDNEHLLMDGEYMSPVDGHNLGNIINDLDTVLKDNRLAFIDDFE